MLRHFARIEFQGDELRLECNFKPYEGTEPYIFLSYSHRDAPRIAPVLEAMNLAGYRIWYDEGIKAGSVWTDSIASHIAKCAVFMAFHSSYSKESEYCFREVHYAADLVGAKKDLSILSVYLNNVRLREGLEMLLSVSQHIYYLQDDLETIMERLQESDILIPCRQTDKANIGQTDQIRDGHPADTAERAVSETSTGPPGNVLTDEDITASFASRKSKEDSYLKRVLSQLKKRKTIIFAAVCVILIAAGSLRNVDISLPERNKEDAEEESLSQTQDNEQLTDDKQTQDDVGGLAGDGTLENPYQIGNAQQLDAVRKNLAAHYVQTADIDLFDVNWQPIGDNEPFTGVFDGNGHIISSMNVNIESTGEISVGGLFGNVDGGTIRNVYLDNCSVSVFVRNMDTAFAQAGGIAGYVRNGSLIECCVFNGTVSARGYGNVFARGAGISAITENGSKIINCYTKASVNAETVALNTMAGGISGWLADSTVENCYVTGRLFASNRSLVYVGGITASGGGEVKNCAVLLEHMGGDAKTVYYDTVSGFAEVDNSLALTEIVDTYGSFNCTGIFEEDAQNQNTYATLGWDFDNVWRMGDKYPELRIFS